LTLQTLPAVKADDRYAQVAKEAGFSLQAPLALIEIYITALYKIPTQIVNGNNVQVKDITGLQQAR
jgi:hypothetical protein